MSTVYRFSLLALLALLLAACSQPTALPQELENTTVAGQYIVVFHERVADVPGMAQRLAHQQGGEAFFVYEHALKGFAFRGSAQAAAALARNPNVAYVEQDQVARIASQAVPTGVTRIFAHENANLGIGSGNAVRINVDVAVIDTGVDTNHPDLDVVDHVDCSGGSPLRGSCKEGGTDVNGHGTHVAGTIGALNNGSGVVGVAPGARIWGVKVLGDNGSGYTSWIIAGIDYVTANADKIAVANMSLGCECSSAAQDQAIANSVAAGVVYVVAAGNSNKDASTFSPANHPDVITVSALADFDGEPGGKVGKVTDRTVYCREDTDDTLANFSNWGKKVDIAAPGVCIKSTWPGGGYHTISGTSMASPHAAGAAAILASKNPPTDKTQALAIRTTLQEEGNYNWTFTNDSGNGIEQPLLDVSNDKVFAPATTSGDDGSGGVTEPEPSDPQPCIPRGNGNNCK